MDNHKEVNFHRIKNIDTNDFVEEDKKSTTRNLTIQQITGMSLGLIHFTCAGILSGYASVIVAQLNATKEYTITKNEATWIASIVIMPTAFSSLTSGFLSTKISKKMLLLVVTLLEVVSWFVMYQSPSVTWILIGRVMNGIANSMGSAIIPQYMGEILHPNIRGVGLTLVFLGMALGMIIIHALGAFFTWRTCALISAIILIIYFCILLYLKETYVWYMKTNKIEEAKKLFYWYRGRNLDAQIELEKLVQRQRENKSTDNRIMDMIKMSFSKLLLMPLLIAAVGMMTMHWSGNKAIMFYSIKIVSQVIPSLDQYASTLIVDAIRLMITIAACFLIHRYPIRTLFLTSGVGSAVSHFSFAALNYYSQEVNDKELSHILSILALIALLGYIIFSSIGLAPLPWVISGEIFPMAVKPVGAALCSFVHFASFFIVVKIAPELFDAVGISGGFIFFGVCTSVGTLVMFFILPETRNKTLKEIEDLFTSEKK